MDIGRVSRHSVLQIVLSVAACAVAAGAHSAAPGDRSGQEVVGEVCAACHAGGLNGAPRIGDAKAWAPRTRRGLSQLTKAALEGVRNMPPHGGSPGLTDAEITRAIIYMVNHSGGSWVEPIDRRAPPATRKGEHIVQAQCVKCHGPGLDGAPRIGDKDAWIQRARFGFESVVRSAINGHGGMPARGGMASLTDDEMRAAVAYMFQKSVAPEKVSDQRQR